MTTKNDQPTDAKPADLTAALTAAAGGIAKTGSARVPGLGRFSVRATQGRKGVRRRVALNMEPELQTHAKVDTAPTDPMAAALFEALGEGKALRIVGLGSFEFTDHPTSRTVHPRTRQTVMVPAHRALTFSGATLKKP